jgi:hypothetical protein
MLGIFDIFKRNVHIRRVAADLLPETFNRRGGSQIDLEGSVGTVVRSSIPEREGRAEAGLRSQSKEVSIVRQCSHIAIVSLLGSSEFSTEE